MNDRADPLALFLADARRIAFFAGDHGTYGLYERLKGMYQARFPAPSSDEYRAAMRQIAEVAGV